MRKIVFGLCLATIATAGSAFINEKKSITESYLVQPTTGSFIRLATAPGTCIASSGLNCKYAVTAFGRLYIPAQSTYTNANIEEYLGDEWIEEIPNVGSGTYYAP